MIRKTVPVLLLFILVLALGCAKTKPASYFKNKTEKQLFQTESKSNFISNGDVGKTPKMPEFKIKKDSLVTQLGTVHLLGPDKSVTPGKISITDSSGKIVGTWKAKGLDLMGIKNAYWNCKPNIVLGPGTQGLLSFFVNSGTMIR